MKKSEIKIGAILSYIIIILNMVIGIAYTPILTRTLGQSEYGLYSLISSIISYLTVLDFGFGNAIIIYTARYRANKQYEKEESLYGMFLIIYTIIGVVAGVIGFIIYANLDRLFGSTMTILELQKAKALMKILTFNLIITFPLSIFTSIITAYEKFVFSKLLNIIRIILNPIIMIILLKFGYRSVALVILNTVLNVGTLILNYIYCKAKLHIKMKFGQIDKIMLKEIMTYSIWIFLNSIMDKINWNVDQFVLGTICGTATVAIYSVANQLNQMYLNFSTAISGVMLPKVAKMEEKNATNEEFTNIFIKTGRIQYIIMGLVMSGFILYGKEFIELMWVGKEYSEAYIIACILMLPLTVPLIQNVGLNIIQAKNQYKFRVMVLLIFAIFNLIITVFLANIWGGIGAATGTALSIICGQIVYMNIFYYKKTHINIPMFWKNIFKMTIPLGTAMFIGIIMKYVFAITTIITLVIEIIIYSNIYIITMYLFGINDYEKQLISKPLEKFLKRIRGTRND